MTVSAGGPLRTTSDALDFDGGDDILIERVEVVKSRGRGIVFDGKDDPNITGGTALRNVVRDCVITGGVPKSGIELLASSEDRVEGCTISDVGGHGIHINKASVTAFQANKPSNDNVIIGNTITNSGIDGVNITIGNRNRILQNTITNSSDDVSGRGGIWIASVEGLPCDANRVEGNRASDDQAVKTQRYGLAIAHSQCAGNVVGDNDFSGNLTAGLLDQGSNTVFTDASAPTSPGDTQATAVNPGSVTIGWRASTDNYGVAGYTIERDGSAVGSVDGSTLTFTDGTVAPATSYTYRVVAFDRAGNRSSASGTVSVTTGEVETVTLNPVADSYVYASQPDQNFGSNAALRTDNSPLLRSFLRFDAQGVAGAGQVLVRVYAETANATGVDLHTVADSGWSESGITFNNAPAIGPVVASSGPIGAGSWASFDVTSVVTADGPVSFALTSPSNTAIRFGSRSSANAPQLVLRAAG
jgi:Right handed beta helix region